jgi:hypothetical protein
MIKEFIKLENKHIPIISIILYCLPFVLGFLLVGNIFSDIELAILRPQLPYLIAGLLTLSYVELTIGAVKFLYFIAIVYTIREVSGLLCNKFKICNDKNSNCNLEQDLDPKRTVTYTYKDIDGITDVTETVHQSVENLLYDGFLLPGLAFVLVLVYMNTQNMILKTLCIIFMIIVYILIVYGNKTISFKYINCNEKEKICYSFFSESLSYALSLVSAFIIMIYF